MTTIRAMAERLIDAPAEQLYLYIADFRQHHSHFLPAAFSDLQVEQGVSATVQSLHFVSPSAAEPGTTARK